MDLPTAATLQAHVAALEAGLLQREAAARLVLLAALAGEHVLLLGPPGTAKSELARRLHRAFDGAPYFERLLTRFSTPEELFGPLSLKALEDDRYERLTAGFLPTAGVAFLDEVFKANSAILNALLGLLNEREFDNGAGRQPTPLVSVVGASNELPADEALGAFFDRFLLRVPVQPVDDAAFAALLQLQPAEGPRPAPITAAQREALHAAAQAVRLGPDLLAGCQALRDELRQRQWPVSDRRWRQFMGLLRVAAASEGRAEADRLDLWLAPHVVAAAHDDVAALADWLMHTQLDGHAEQAPWLTTAVQAFEQQLEIEQGAEAGDEGQATAGKLALARAIGGGEAGDAPLLRMVPAGLDAQTRRRYSPVHVAARTAQLDELLQGLHPQEALWAARLAEREAQLTGRWWMPPALRQALRDAPRQTLARLQALRARAEACRVGFAALPLDDAAAAEAPAPVAWAGAR